MLDGLKRLFARGGSASKEWATVQPWAVGKGYGFRAVQNEGFVVEGQAGNTPWRLEWGPSQRSYITGNELRIRSELGLGSDLHVMLMNRALQEQMEAAVFSQYTEGVQTRIDDQTPPEMRWLVMFPKLTGSELGELRDRYVGLASRKSWLLRWLQGPLSSALAFHRVDDQLQQVLMIGRGRLMLRTAMPEAELGEIERWLRVFETAVREARRVVNDSGEGKAPAADSQQPRHPAPDQHEDGSDGA